MLSILLPILVASALAHVSPLQLPRASHRRQEHRYLHAHSASHAREAVFLVAAVTSPASSRERRGWVREQWKRNVALLQESLPPERGGQAPRLVMKFAVGVNESSREALQQLREEDEAHGDILSLHGVKDMDPPEAGWPWRATSGTTEKVLFSIQWAVESYQFEYFARLGDDAYFRPDEFYRQARAGEFPASMAVIGFFIGPYSYETGAGQNTLIYPAGMGCVLTPDIAAWIASSAGILGVGYPEDAVVGSWLAATQARFVHVDTFHDMHPAEYGYRPCSPRDILVHHMQAEADWRAINGSGVVTC